MAVNWTFGLVYKFPVVVRAGSAARDRIQAEAGTMDGISDEESALLPRAFLSPEDGQESHGARRALPSPSTSSVSCIFSSLPSPVFVSSHACAASCLRPLSDRFK